MEFIVSTSGVVSGSEMVITCALAVEKESVGVQPSPV